MLLFEHCTASCGYAAAFISCLSFGSFCVPMKGKAAKEVDAHPLVFQSYKTLMCFLTSFSVLFLGVEKLTFSPWGIVSGIFWVPAGITYICGIRTAGLAICHGTAASIIVMVSFSWGIFVFHERVRSLTSALFAVFLMVCGIFGMSFAAAPRSSSSTKVFAKADSKEAPRAIFCFQRGCLGDKMLTWAESRQGAESPKDGMAAEMAPIVHIVEDRDLEDRANPAHGLGGSSESENSNPVGSASHRCPSRSQVAPRSCEHIPLSVPLAQARIIPPCDDLETPPDSDVDDPAAKDKGRVSGTTRRGAEAIVSGMVFYAKTRLGVDLTVRQMGLLIAALGSVWGGSVMVPLHYAGEEAQGLGFVFSFAMGSSLVNIVIWVLCFLSALRQHGCDCGAALGSLPPFHCSKMAVPGGLSGVLWSIGNMASMISVTYLGEGVGYSMTQSAMLVSGMWGIFLFKEITDPAAIRGWMASACLTISGILLLSYNHLPPNAPAVLKKS